MPELFLTPQGGSGGGGGERGPEGPAGPKGEFNYRGAYSAATEYAKGDAVTEGGSTYASLKAANLNHTPSALGEWWALIAKEGKEGKEGPKGTAGEKGVTGEKGTTGEKGEKGATGEKGINWRGAYKKQAWTINDACSAGGSSYICVKAMTEGESVEPPEATHWELIAEKGSGGGGSEWEPKALEGVHAGLTVVSARVAANAGLGVLSGTLEVTTEQAAGTVVFTLPEAARPAKAQRMIVTRTGTTVAFQGIEITPTGEVKNLQAWPVASSPVGFAGAYLLK